MVRKIGTSIARTIRLGSRLILAATVVAALAANTQAARAQVPNPPSDGSPAPATKAPATKAPAKKTPAKKAPGKQSQASQEKPDQGGADQGGPDQSNSGGSQGSAPKTLPNLLVPYDLAAQSTLIFQHLSPFHSPYAGASSLPSRSESEVSSSTTAFLGVRFTRGIGTFEAYLDPEWALGQGIGGGTGLGEYPNGDLIGQNVMAPDPYFARYYVLWRISTGTGPDTGRSEQIGRSENIISGLIPARRVVIMAGKFAASDVFDANAYANNSRTEFMNLAFSNNPAYDSAQDVRGYTEGLALSWVNPAWALRAATFAMPDVAGGTHLSGDYLHNHGDQIEYDRNIPFLKGKAAPATVRLLAYRNLANMGSYRDALAAVAGTANAPDITTVRHRGASKYGFGVNFDQALADGGNTGLFGRWGWNDGATESVAFMEADRSLSFGGQLSGAHWGRAKDRVGLGFVRDGITAVHQAYLAAGGIGLNAGDGKLSYGPEQAVEAYYAYQLSTPATVSVGLQEIRNPGYNRDRGPVIVPSVRMHAEF